MIPSPPCLSLETGVKFTLAIFSAPDAPSSRRALRFAEALLEQGHELTRLFFYQDAVQLASSSRVTPQDETDWPAAWSSFIARHQLDAVVCIAAALRRGVLDAAEAERYGRQAVSVEQPWVLSGLGQLHDAAQDSDRLVCFGGD